KIYVDPTGEVGSIGVIMTHVDMSKMLETWGYKMTHIFSGDRKADGSPYEPLDDAARARMQSDVDYLRGLFASNVAANRSVSDDFIKNTQAMTFIGQLGIDSGLAD